MPEQQGSPTPKHIRDKIMEAVSALKYCADEVKKDIHPSATMGTYTITETFGGYRFEILIVSE